MTTAGFGGTGTIGKIDPPWPHNMLGFPVSSNGPKMDNVPTMGPAGTMHMTLRDWGKFISEHIRGGSGGSRYLNREQFEMLHNPIAEDYAVLVATNRTSSERAVDSFYGKLIQAWSDKRSK